MKTTMPSETITGVVGSLVGAVVAILGAYGTDIPAGAVGGIIILLSWMAYAVTLVVRARRAARKHE